MSDAPPRAIETDAQLVALADAIEAEHRETEAIQVARETAGQDAFAPDFIEGTIQPRVRKSWEMRGATGIPAGPHARRLARQGKDREAVLKCP